MSAAYPAGPGGDPREDELAQRYLAVLRDGSDEQKIAARENLARIFERRGMLAEAAELYEGNLRAGVRNRAIYTRLALLYRRQGQIDRAQEALAVAARIAPPPGPRPGDTFDVAAPPPAQGIEAPPPQGTGAPHPPGQPDRPGRPRALLVWAAAAVLGIIAAGTLLGAQVSDPPATVAKDEGAGPADGANVAVGTATPTPPLETPTPAVTPNMALAASTQPLGCTFELGFAELRTAIGPEIVGDCLENQSFAENGDARQPTTRGELVWRKADNRTVFTNGSETWLTGPNGVVQKRLNSDRFAWEPDAQQVARATATATPFPLGPVLPGSILPAKRVVSYYGNQLSSAMGILGEMTPPQMMARLREQADAYAAADRSKPVQPALELVAIVAQEGPGRDGLYRLRMDTEVIEEVAQWAEKNNFLLILDIQVSRSNVAAEVQAMMPYLRRPYVHLALDPEFAMKPDQKPGEVIGSHSAADINVAVEMLADLVSAENLPPKMLLVHRFTERMVTNYRQIKIDPRVQVVMVMDGFGSPTLKTEVYGQLIHDQRVQYSGFKLFYRQDKPLMSPQDVLKLDPVPDVVIYQ